MLPGLPDCRLCVEATRVMQIQAGKYGVTLTQSRSGPDTTNLCANEAVGDTAGQGGIRKVEYSRWNTQGGILKVEYSRWTVEQRSPMLGTHETCQYSHPKTTLWDFHPSDTSPRVSPRATDWPRAQ